MASNFTVSQQTIAPKTAIYHGFNETYEALRLKLPELKAAGYDAVQTSPPHRFRTDLPRHCDPRTPPDVWWLAYQPTSYEISNKYGDAVALTTLCDQAHALEMKVIVDICLNFMSALPGIEASEWNEAEKPGNEALLESYWDQLDKAYPPFTRKDYLPRFPIESSKDASSKRRFKSFWFNGGMPGLRLDSPTVRAVHFAYLDRLANEIGVDGFRVDAALYQTPEIFRSYFKRYPTKWTYLEIFERYKPQRVEPYRELPFSLEDFLPTTQLIKAVNGAFAPGSWNKEEGFELLSSVEFESVMVRPEDVTFAMNHDTYSNLLDSNHGISGLKFVRLGPADPRRHSIEPWDVGHAILLAIRNGIPLILNSLAESSVINAGLLFRSRMISIDAPPANFPGLVISRQKSTSSSSRDGNPKRFVLWMERGDHGFLVCNCNQNAMTIEQLKESAILRSSGIVDRDSLLFKAINNPTILKLTISPNVTIQSCIEGGGGRWINGVTLQPGALLFFLRAEESELKLPEDSSSVRVESTTSTTAARTKTSSSSSSRSRVQGASWSSPSKPLSSWSKK
eukprot:TRINITY_DN7485_c0_g1_i1.p1 TRINITY_DN7485_c0_g1~~TRINITY_DN7485_c0_g1_i1.p1  ORF type:complete len:566 (-),score=103.36 TRINITY_DN7485_c0_g1_i1:86-1783(-)